MKIKEFLLQDEANEYYTDLIVFDDYVELADVKKAVQAVKDKYKDEIDETYSCDEIHQALWELCPFTYYWLGVCNTITY